MTGPMEFTIRPIGTNAAFSVKGYNTNYIIEGPQGRFLFDCGSTAGRALDRIGLNLSDFQEVYLSHLHLDHVGGLVQLGLSRFSAGMERAKLYCHIDLAEKIWPLFLQSFMTRAISRDGQEENFEFADFFELSSLPDPGDDFTSSVTISGIRCTLFRSRHPASSECHGLILNEKVLITSDTIFMPEKLEEAANRFPLEAIFHHCTYNPALAGMHATVEQLRSLPGDLRELIILSHYDDHMTGKHDPVFELAIPGQVYKF